MSLIETYHTEHKARLARLGAIPSNTLAPMPQQYRLELQALQTKVERQKAIISDLNSIVSKQRSIIRAFADETESPTPRIADVVAVVAEHYKFTKQMLIGTQRTDPIAFARQVGYYICRELGFAWLAIGRGFLKDHTAALHGYRKIAERVSANPALGLEIETIKTEIDKYVARRILAAKEALT